MSERSAGQAPMIDAAAINAYLSGEFPGHTVCVEVGADYAVARFDASGAVLRPGGIVSGPTLFGLCDAVLWYALFGAVGLEPMALTSELSIRFLRPARGDAVFGRADLHHVGKRSVIGSIRCWMEHEPEITVAVAQGTYVRPRVRPEGRSEAFDPNAAPPSARGN